MAKILLAAMTFACLTEHAFSDPKVVPMKFGRSQPRKALRKRDPVPVTLGNAVAANLYYVNASVGTPPQMVSLQIDTGSSDVWMFGPSACSDPSQCLGGTFDPSKSSSSTLLARGGFEIQYVTPGSGVMGDYISDNFGLGKMAISNLTMAVATQAQQVETGIMGIGFDNFESIVAQGAQPYPNIIDEMANQGLIASRSYSLYLDDLNDATGTALFGGYDTAKYTGDLVLLDIQPDQETGVVDSMVVAWTSLAVTDSTGSTLLTPEDFPLPAVLDSGTTLTVMPSDLFAQLFDYFGAVSDGEMGSLIECSVGNAEGSLDFGFGDGPIISVPFNELAVPAFDEQGNPLTFEDGSPACQLGVAESPDGVSILLGDTFLRSAYVVYDLDAQQIGIAQTKFNSTDSNIVEISNSSSNPIASAVSAATGISAAQTATSLIAPGFGATITGTSGGGLGRPTSAGGLGQVTGVRTSLPVQTFGGGIATSAGAGPATVTAGNKSSASALPAPMQSASLLLACWVTIAVVMGSAAFSFLF